MGKYNQEEHQYSPLNTVKIGDKTLVFREFGEQLTDEDLNCQRLLVELPPNR